MSTLLQISQLGNPVLNRKAEEITDPAAPEIQKLIDDMLETMYEAYGVGLAAPQIFQSLRLFVMDPTAKRENMKNAKVVINPEIVSHGNETDKHQEGCLSVPCIVGMITRYQKISVRYTDRKGNTVEDTLEGFPARIFQHENDHLNGILFVDRVESSKDLFAEKEFHKQNVRNC